MNQSRRWIRMLAASAACALFGLPLRAQAAQTLRDVLRENRIPLGASSLRDLDQPITSFASSDSTDLFIIAYYSQTLGVTALADTLRVAAYDKAAATWHYAAIPRIRPPVQKDDPPWFLGSVLDIHRTATRLYLDTHVNPSAGIVLVLNRNLEPVTTLYGWVLCILPTDVVVYHRSMIHFAPTHAAEIWTYDPRTQRDAILYPRKPLDALRRSYPEPFDSALQDSIAVSPDGHAIAFIDEFGDREKTALEVAVVCRDVATAAARCSESKLSELRSRHPDWTTTRVLRELLTAR